MRPALAHGCSRPVPPRLPIIGIQVHGVLHGGCWPRSVVRFGQCWLLRGEAAVHARSVYIKTSKMFLQESIIYLRKTLNPLRPSGQWDFVPILLIIGTELVQARNTS